MNSRAQPRALYLPSGTDTVFGLLHTPAADARRDTAVLVCPPFGWEDVCSYRSRRDWAEQLAQAGYPTLRIDLPGTGDSSGSFDDRGLLAAWIGAVDSASSWLRAATDSVSVAAIGIGLGGLLAYAAIAEGALLDELILWAVPSRGSAFIRELRAFGRMESSKFAARGESPKTLPEGYTGAGGFVLSAETTRALDELDLATVSLPAGQPRRALLLTRDGIGVDERLLDRLRDAGTAVSVAPGAGYSEMMAEPQESRAPTEVFAQVRSWLEESSSIGAASSQALGGEGTSPARDEVAGAVRHPAIVDRATAELTVAGVRIRETPLSIEQPWGRLFGVLAEPAGGQAHTPGLGAILLNAGAIRRIGPNRMWVEIARHWAALGVPCLRLDLEGLGDADGDSERFAEVAELYVPGLVAQVLTAVDELEARHTAGSFVLAGLCSGAYWSFHGALQDERVQAAFMLNPRTLFWDASQETLRYVRRGLLQPSSWRMILRGDVRLSRMSAVVRHTPRSLLAHTIAERPPRGQDELDVALDRLRDTHKHLVFLFSENEPLHRELERQGRLGQSKRWPNLELALIPGGDHTLRPLRSQRHAQEALDRALGHELERIHA